MSYMAIMMLCIQLGYAQIPPRHEIPLDELIERLFPAQEEDLDYESIYELVLQLYLNPIDINQASAEILGTSYILDPLLINNLLDYRNSHGPFISLYEIQAVPGFTPKVIDQILPFITLNEASTRNTQSLWNRIKNEEQAYVIVRHRRVWEQRRGYTAADTSSTGRISSRYLGDPNDLYLRFRIQHSKDFSLGFTLDKDAGEQFIWDKETARYGFNFQSFHLTKYNLGNWKTISLGDYQAQFGQGLVFGAGYTIGKGAETVPTVRRSNFGILPYTAAMEYGYFRGIGISHQKGKIQTSFLLSYAPRDGRANLDTLGQEDSSISSFNQSGLHRTLNEIASKNRFRELSIGSNITYMHPAQKFQAGANYLYTQFQKEWKKDFTPYNQFDFRGKQNQVASIYASYNYKNFFFFGESAISQSGGQGTVVGFISSLSKQLDFSFLWRNYERDFHSFYANAFSEGTRPANERGSYLGLQYQPNRTWKLNLYYDFFKFPWLRYRVYSPSYGYEWLARLTYQPQRSLKAYLQIREEKKDRNTPSGVDLYPSYLVLPIQKINGMLSLEYQVNPSFFFRSRVLFSQINFNNQRSNGFLILQDAQYGIGKARFTGRFALFDTDDYDNRQYAFENNVLWTFSIPAYYGQGMRFYLLSQYKFSSQLTVYFRFARTNYTDRETIGTGLQTINSPTQTESTLLLKYMLHR